MEVSTFREMRRGSFRDATIGEQTNACRSPRRKELTLGKRCAFAVIPLVTLLLLAELVIRCFVSDFEIAWRFRQIEQIIVFLGSQPRQSIFEPDPNCFWRLKPNIIAPSERGTWWGGVMSNSQRMRSREVSVAEANNRFRVLCFGDSTTFGFGVDFADAWPNQLQTLFDKELPNPDHQINTLARSASEGPHHDEAINPSLARRASLATTSHAVEVLNAGIPGHTSYQGRQRLAAELAKWRPHLAVITFGNNDGWRWDGLADKEHAQLARPSAATSWFDHSRAWRWLHSQRMQSAHQQAAHEESRWAEQVSWNYIEPNATWTPRVSLSDFADNLHAMIDVCRRQDCEVVLIVWPDQRQLLDQPTWRLPYQVAMRQVAREADVPCVDLVPLFEATGRWAVERFLPRDVIHVDRAGNQLVARAVAAHVRRLMAQ